MKQETGVESYVIIIHPIKWAKLTQKEKGDIIDLPGVSVDVPSYTQLAGYASILGKKLDKSFWNENTILFYQKKRTNERLL
jgi:hypothetical protein